MTNYSKIPLYCVLLLLAAVVAPGTSVADEYPLESKLQQCEAVFEKMHSGTLTQSEAWTLRREHKTLVAEILDNLNKRNHLALQSSDRTISNEEVLENLVVMGSLLQMMSIENLRQTDEWGYQLEDE